MNTKQLKQKILSLAIRGQLVPQDPSDEPASELLKRIKAERESTVEKGRKKKATTDTSHYQQQPPFELPEGWVWCKLGEIFYLKAGENITSKDISEIKKEDFIYPCYGGNGIRGYTKQYNKEGIFSLIGRQGALCGNINIGKGKFFATEHAVVVNTFSETNVNWCFYFLKQLNLNQYATSTAQPGLSVNNINQIYIPLPPLKEQDRIANEIDRLFTLIEQLEEDKAALQQLVSQLKSKILSLAIRGQLVPQDANDEPAEVLLKQINPEYKSRGNLHYQPFEIPKSWVWCKLRDIGEIITGNTPSKDNDSNYGDDYPFYKPSDLEVGINIFDAQDKLSKQGYELARKLSKNTLLVTCIGSLGKCGIIKKEGSCNQQINAILSNEHIDMEYLYYVVSSSYFQKLIRKTASATTVAIINKRKFSDLIIPLPPLAEQQLISEKITELFNIIDNIQNALSS
jgi:type I restriction enzyme ecoAI specificity protein